MINFLSIMGKKEIHKPREVEMKNSGIEVIDIEKNQEIKRAKVAKASETLKESDKMSSKFAEVGRSIVLALVAGSWILLRVSTTKTDAFIFIKVAIILAFVYLLVDLLYYGYTMITYWKFVNFDTDNYTLFVKDDKETFLKQTKLKKFYMINLTVIKASLLFLAIVCICLFVFIA